MSKRNCLLSGPSGVVDLSAKSSNMKNTSRVLDNGWICRPSILSGLALEGFEIIGGESR